MPQDPATAFQQASINVPYSFQPTVTNLGGSHLFGGAGQLWAEVGKTAMAAGDMLQHSALNPAERAKMQYGIDQYKFAQDHLAWLRSKGDWGQMAAGTGPEGVSTVPAGTTSVDQMVRMGLLGQGAGGGGGGGGAPRKGHDVDESERQPTTSTTPRTDLQTDAEGVQWFFNPATSNWERLQSPEQTAPTTKPARRPRDRPKDPSDLLTLNTQVPSQGGSTSDLSASTDNNFLLGKMMAQGGLVREPRYYAAGGHVTDKSDDSSASADQDALIARMIAERQAAGLDRSIEPPAPIQPVAQLHPAAAQPQGSSIWSPQRPSPVAPPPAPAQQPSQGPQMTLGATAKPPPGMELAGTEQAFPQRSSQQDQTALASWQAQNAHPVMASSDALNWAKNFDTGAQRATYLPHGGPQGEPAYAFHMKGGGVNTVPISQIVKNGGGAAVAGQNTSAALSASDALTNPPPGQAPGMTLGATAQPPPGMALGQGQPGQPPAAPAQGGQVWNPLQPAPGRTAPLAAPGMTDVYGNPLSAYTNVPSKGGPTDVTAGTTAAGQPTEAGTTAPPVPNVGQEQPLTHLTGHSMEELSKMDSDPAAGSFAGFNWYQDRHDGKFYTTMKSPSSTLDEQRYYWGGPGWQNMPMEESGLRQALRDIVKEQRGINFSDAETRDMPIDDVKFWLEEGKYLKQTGGDPSGTTALHIKGTIQQSQSLARTIAMLEAAKKEGIDPKLFNTGAQSSSEEVAKREEMLPPSGQEYPAYKDPVLGLEWGGPSASWDLGWAAVHGARTTRTGGQVSPLADKMRSEINYFTDIMGQTPGIKYSTGGKPEESSVPIEGQAWQGGPSGRFHIPSPAELSTLKEINRISSGGDINAMISGAKQLKAKIDQEILDSTDLATRLNFRTPPGFKKAVDAIKNHQNIEDNNNEFLDRNGNPRMPDQYKSPPGMLRNIPEGKGGNQVEEEMQRFYGNRPRPQPAVVNSLDEATTFARTKPSGTYFIYKGHQYMVE